MLSSLFKRRANSSASSTTPPSLQQDNVKNGSYNNNNNSNNTILSSSPPSSPQQNPHSPGSSSPNHGNHHKGKTFETPIGVHLIPGDNEGNDEELLAASAREQRFNYNTKTGEPIDPTLELIPDGDSYMTSGQFIRVKSEMEGVQSKEVVLLFCKKAIYSIKMPNYLQHLNLSHHISATENWSSSNRKQDRDFGETGASGLGDGFAARRRRSGVLAIQYQPIMRGSGHLRIDASTTSGFTGITHKRRATVGWRIPLIHIHSVEPSIHFTNMFTVWYFDDRRTKNKSQDRYMFCKTYECEKRQDRDEWIIVIGGIIQNYYQSLFEKSIIPAPEIYQYHSWVLLPKKKERYPLRCLVLSTERIYILKAPIKEDYDKSTKSEMTIPIPSISLKSYRKTPATFALVYGNNCQLEVKCRDIIDMANVLKEMARLYFAQTRKLPRYEKLD